MATDTASVHEEWDFLEDHPRSAHVGSGFIKFKNMVTSKCWQVFAHGSECEFKLPHVPAFYKAVLGELLSAQGSR